MFNIKKKKELTTEYLVTVLDKLVELKSWMKDKQKIRVIDEFENFIIKEKNDRLEKVMGDKIISKGQDIIKRRAVLADMMLMEEKSGRDVKLLKIKIEAYDEILRMIQ